MPESDQTAKLPLRWKVRPKEAPEELAGEISSSQLPELQELAVTDPLNCLRRLTAISTMQLLAGQKGTARLGWLVVACIESSMLPEAASMRSHPTALGEEHIEISAPWLDPAREERQEEKPEGSQQRALGTEGMRLARELASRCGLGNMLFGDRAMQGWDQAWPGHPYPQVWSHEAEGWMEMSEIAHREGLSQKHRGELAAAISAASANIWGMLDPQSTMGGRQILEQRLLSLMLLQEQRGGSPGRPCWRWQYERLSARTAQEAMMAGGSWLAALGTGVADEPPTTDPTPDELKLVESDRRSKMRSKHGQGEGSLRWVSDLVAGCLLQRSPQEAAQDLGKIFSAINARVRSDMSYTYSNRIEFIKDAIKATAAMAETTRKRQEEIALKLEAELKESGHRKAAQGLRQLITGEAAGPRELARSISEVAYQQSGVPEQTLLNAILEALPLNTETSEIPGGPETAAWLIPNGYRRRIREGKLADSWGKEINKKMRERIRHPIARACIEGPQRSTFQLEDREQFAELRDWLGSTQLLLPKEELAKRIHPRSEAPADLELILLALRAERTTIGRQNSSKARELLVEALGKRPSEESLGWWQEAWRITTDRSHPMRLELMAEFSHQMTNFEANVNWRSLDQAMNDWDPEMSEAEQRKLLLMNLEVMALRLSCGLAAERHRTAAALEVEQREDIGRDGLEEPAKQERWSNQNFHQPLIDSITREAITSLIMLSGRALELDPRSSVVQAASWLIAEAGINRGYGEREIQRAAWMLARPSLLEELHWNHR